MLRYHAARFPRERTRCQLRSAGVPTSDKRLALNKRLVKIQADIAHLRRDREVVKRDEFVQMSKSLQQLQKNTTDLVKHSKDLAIQFGRIAQIQAEVDAIKLVPKRAGLSD
jgi:hypothetical protein